MSAVLLLKSMPLSVCAKIFTELPLQLPSFIEHSSISPVALNHE